MGAGVRVTMLGVVVLVLAACGGPSGRLAAEDPSGPSATTAPDATSSPTPSCTPTAEPTTPPVATAPEAPTADPTGPESGPTAPPAPGPAESTATEGPDRLAAGDRGADVHLIQERLTELGYWLGTPDGVFGDSTHHAVVALQKAAGISRDGIVGPQTRGALEQGVRPQPRSTNGAVIEVDRARQLLLLVEDGHLRWTFDTSTGRPGLTTPAGHFEITRTIDGERHAPLGTLYRPVYFNGGIAVHGFPSVPPYPASHGCVRVTNAAMDWMWAHGIVDVGTPVTVD